MLKRLYKTLNTKVNKSEKNIPHVSKQINTTQTIKTQRKKIGDVENKIADITGLATTVVLTAEISEFQDKIPDVTEFVKKSRL